MANPVHRWTVDEVPATLTAAKMNAYVSDHLQAIADASLSIQVLANTNLWTNPGTGRLVTFYVIAGGGGGAGGANTGVGIQANGGGGGGAGGLSIAQFRTGDLPATLYTYIPLGAAAGGAGQTASAATSAGTAGTNAAMIDQIGPPSAIYVGAFGGAGGDTAGGGGLAGTGFPVTPTLNNGFAGLGTPDPGVSGVGGSGGAGGGQITAANANGGGGKFSNGSPPQFKPRASSAISGDTDNIPGLLLFFQNMGGGGGNAEISINAQAGAAGGFPGGGGGGGGAGRSTHTSGAGGAGGAATIIAVVQ